MTGFNSDFGGWVVRDNFLRFPKIAEVCKGRGNKTTARIREAYPSREKACLFPSGVMQPSNYPVEADF